MNDYNFTTHFYCVCISVSYIIVIVTMNYIMRFLLLKKYRSVNPAEQTINRMSFIEND